MAQVSQPIDLQQLFMHQLQQQIVPQQLQQQQQQQQQLQQQQLLQQQQQQAITEALVNSTKPSIITSTNPLLNGATSIVTNSNINVTYLNGAIKTSAQYGDDGEKFKMPQGFIAVLKVE